jgi:5'-phosphate synthase pdxT subunit
MARRVHAHLGEGAEPSGHTRAVQSDGAPHIGVLALQGDFAAHMRMVEAAGARASEIRRPRELDDVAGLIIPGGESTALSLLLDFEDMRGAVASFAAHGGALFGTCAGLILLAREVVPRTPSEPSIATFGLLDVAVARNDYGRQRESFEAETDVPVLHEEHFPLAFIRAPRIVSVGPSATPLAEYGGAVVLVRQGRVLGATFHPEIVGDPRLHAYFAREITRPAHSGGHRRESFV